MAVWVGGRGWGYGWEVGGGVWVGGRGWGWEVGGGGMGGR